MSEPLAFCFPKGGHELENVAITAAQEVRVVCGRVSKDSPAAARLIEAFESDSPVNLVGYGDRAGETFDVRIMSFSRERDAIEFRAVVL